MDVSKILALVPYLAAFPGLPATVAALWLRAFRRYETHMAIVASYPDPTVEEVADRGLLSTYRRTAAGASAMDAAARTGSLGPDAQRLERLQRRWFYAVGLSIPIGMGLAFFVGWLLAA